jgi:serine/threonine protein kinase
LSLPPGIATDLLSGKYRVLRPVGGSAGGRDGTVRDGVVCLLAEHASIQRDVEIKLLVERSAAVEARLFREARALGSVSHPSTRSVLDSGVDADGRPFIVYEALVGPTLAEVLKASPRGLPVERAAGIAMHILEGLRALHRNRVVVRGLAPEHIVLVDAPNGEVAKIAQVDRAAFIGEPGGDDPVRFSPWIAPEIRRGGEGLDIRADVYSAGVMLRHLLTGRPQEGDPLPDTAARAIARSAAEDPEERFPNVEVLMQCVALMLPTSKRVARDHMPIPSDPLAADLHYLALRRSTRHGTLDFIADSDAKLHLLLVLVTVEAIYRRLGESLWEQLVEAIPSVEEVLPGSGRTSEHMRAGVPVALVAQILEKADQLGGRGDLQLVAEISGAIAQRALRRLCPDLPAVLTTEAIVDGFPYIWSRIARDGKAEILDRTHGSAKVAVEGHAPSLEVTGLTAGLLRAALREAGAPLADVSIVACSALGDVRDVFIARWSRPSSRPPPRSA